MRKLDTEILRNARVCVLTDIFGDFSFIVVSWIILENVENQSFIHTD